MEVSASLLNVKKEDAISTFYNLEAAHVDYFHIDVMDGEFVKNNTEELMSFYADTLNGITTIPLDIHLMCKNVKKCIDEFAPCAPRIINFHIESCKDGDEVMNLINHIKNSNSKVGIAINPETPISNIFEFLPYIHSVLVMSVHPGKGGQEFIEETVSKVKTLRKYIEDHGLETEIEVDGGINIENGKKIFKAGADIATVGSFLINSKDRKYDVEQFHNLR